jgi:signal peptidase
MLNTIKKIASITYKILLILLLLMMIVIGISVMPLPNNYKIYSVVSGSMQPAITPGSIVLVKPMTTYKVNDIVTMRTPEPRKTITHRVITKIEKKGQITYETKGDANKAKDSQLLLQQNIIGKVFFSIPLLGYPVAYSKTLPGLIFLIVIPATIIIYSELMNIKNEALRLIQERKQRKLTPFEKVEEKIDEEIIAVEKEVKKDIKKVFKKKKKA